MPLSPPPLPDDRPIARTTVLAIVRALGYEPRDVVAVRLGLADGVEVEVIGYGTHPSGLGTRVVRHQIREDR